MPDVRDVFSVVDWVLVCIRSQPTDPDTACRAGLLLSDATILDPETWSAEVRLGPALPGQYHVVVYHRTHLAVMTASRIQLADGVPSAEADLTKGAFGAAGIKQVAPGLFAMVAGDANADGRVLADDYNNVWLPTVGQTGYLLGDFNLDGSVLANDQQVLWLPNVGVQSTVPGSASALPPSEPVRQPTARR
ncbi:MAG: hypothetical protein AAGI52_18700 [Bacteroidota bacterium]